MIKRNLTIILRGFKNHKKYTLINILGFAIGLTCFILISIWVQDELSYDNFHKDANNIYIVLRNADEKQAAVSSKLLAPTIKEEIPEIEESTCFMRLPESFNSVFQYNEKKFTESIALADEHFFNVFSFSLLKGNPATFFTAPNSVLISERIKQKYFGNTNALGKSISITVLGQKKLLQVTGILENMPHNSHIQSGIILPFEFMNDFGVNWDVWYNQAPNTYIRTQGKVSESQLEKKILACKQNHFTEENMSYSVLPVTKIHLHTSNVEYFTSTGDIKYVYIFSATAIIIMLIASMNYMSLSNALSLKRSREIGIKKALGSKREQVIKQCFLETIILVFFALVFAFFLVHICLPILNNISGKNLSVPYTDPKFIISILGIFTITSLVSAAYPALYMSGFKPVQVLKGKLISSPGSTNIRTGLVVFQFVLSIIIIISTITISNQLKFIQSSNLGYDKEHIVCAQIKGDISQNFEAFRNEILSSGLVLNVSRSGNMDGNSMGQTYGINWPGKQKKFQIWVLNVDEEFAKTYGIKIDKGRFYSRDFSTDLTNGFVVNQTAIKEMNIENPIGHELEVWGRKGTIIGITNDFHFNSLHNKIEPLLLRIPEPEEVNSRCSALSIRIKPNSLPQSLDYIEKTWKSYFPDESFDYSFIDEKLKTNYLYESRMGTLFKYFSFMVILIACLGLYGLTSFTIEQKTKEIGVNKVMGATIPDIMFLFSKSYILWIVIATIIASPIAYYAMHKWLENFAYKTTLSWWFFVLAGGIALFIALLAVTWQTWQAANKNPVEALRYE